jgi:cyanophycin synthetase
LNADDPLVAEMAAATCSEVVYFSSNPDNHIISAHLAGGGRSVLLQNDKVVLAEGERRIELVSLQRVSFTAGGSIAFQVENALAATAAAWAAGLNPAIIARALTTFRSDPASTPGRFNVSESDGIQVIVDYGHNSAALRALLEGAGALGQRRTILVIALPGDRRDQDLCDAIHVTLPYVDEYVFYEARNLRGRPSGEISRLSQGCLTPGHPSVLASSQVDGIRKGMERARPGDRLIVIVDDVDEALSVVQKRDRCCADDTTCDMPIAPDLVSVQ